MDFRLATEHDIPAIVQLLTHSLGNAATRKTEAFWRWKHLENPFGPSPVLLAEADDRLVGVRAFMPWRWERGQQSFRALRPVDTATHPDYRRRGVFQQLTLNLAGQCQEQGYDFLFNTPNPQSRAGYMKMGWVDRGPLPVRIKIGTLRRPSRKKQTDWYRLFPVSDALEKLEPGIERISAKGMTTGKKVRYLRWRYESCPVRRYGGVHGSGFLLLFNLRDHRFGLELRITELILHDGYSRPGLTGALRELIAAFRPLCVTIAPGPRSLPGPGMDLPLGPRLCVRSLQAPLTALPGWSDWHYSLGDMELF